MSLPESTLLNTAQKVKEKAGKAHFAAEVGRVIADKALELAKGAFTSNNPEDARLIENIADDALSEANLAKNDADQAKEEAARIRFIAERALLDSPGSQDAMDAKTIADGAGIEADNARVEAEKAIAIADIARAYAKSVAATAPSASAPLTTAGANANRPAANTNPAGTPPAEFAPLTTAGANANRPAANTNPAGTNPTADANANRLAVNGNPAGTPPAAGTNANRPAANGNPAGTTPAESAPLTTTGANSNRPAANTNPAVNSLDQDSIPSQEQRTVEPLFTIRNTGSSDKAFQVICINSDLPFKVTQWSSPQFFDEEGRNISNLFSCSSVEMLDSTEGCFDWEQRHIGAYRLTLSAVVKFKLPDGQTREVQVSPRNFEFFNGMVH